MVDANVEVTGAPHQDVRKLSKSDIDPDVLELAKLIIEEERLETENMEAEDEDTDKVCRALKIKPHNAFGTWVVIREGGGKVPVILRGMFTDHDTLVRMIASYKAGTLKPQGKWADKIKAERERLMSEKAKADQIAKEIKDEKETLSKMQKELEEIKKLKQELQDMKDNLKKSA